MTSATETAALSPTAQGAILLQDYLATIGKLGYTKVAVDTWRNDAERHTLRHSYRNGEWTIKAWADGSGPISVLWTVRDNMPDVSTLVSATLPPAF